LPIATPPIFQYLTLYQFIISHFIYSRIHTNQNKTASTGQSPLDLDAIRRLYGSGLAMRLATERQMAKQVGGRLPGLDAHPDSRAMYETLTGEDVTLDFGDYLNLSKNRPEVGGGNGGGGALGGEEIPHAAMESRLGL
jgi:hypothetical protein